MTHNEFKSAAQKYAIGLVPNLLKEGNDMTHGAVLALDPEIGVSADLALATLESRDIPEQDARQTIVEAIAAAKANGGTCVIGLWLDSASLRGLLGNVGIANKSLDDWLSGKTAPGFVRLVAVQGDDVKCSSVPFAHKGQA